MTIYVDTLQQYNNRLWCHMATDGDIEELHVMAVRIGLKREWFQPHRLVPHYDLTPNKRALALAEGAISVIPAQLVKLTL